MALFRVTISALTFGQLCQNVLFFQKTDAVVATDMSLLADDIDANWIEQSRNPLASDVNYFQIKVDHFTGSPGAATFTKNIIKTGGNGFDSSCPLNVAWVLRLETGLSGRQFRGRVYLPGLRPGYCTSGLVNATGQALWPTRITNLKARYTDTSHTSTFDLVLHHRGNDPTAIVHINDIVLRTTPGSMRRRMLGVGQ